MEPSRDIGRLIEIMAALRNPDGGCPWDLKQSFATIAPYTIEEAYEVADAIDREDMADLRDELGDLLLQVVYHARLAEEEGAFAFADVVEAVTAKMIRRHPHVFGDRSAKDAEAVTESWEAIKAAEREEKRRGETPSLLDDVPLALPALTRAAKLQRRAAGVGFDWTNAIAVLAKVREEIGELEAEIARGDPEAVEEEVGDLIFTVVNLARHLRVDPENATRKANAKFRRRFNMMERTFQEAGQEMREAGPDRLEAAWEAAKAAERRPGS